MGESRRRPWLRAKPCCERCGLVGVGALHAHQCSSECRPWRRFRGARQSRVRGSHRLVSSRPACLARYSSEATAPMIAPMISMSHPASQPMTRRSWPAQLDLRERFEQRLGCRRRAAAAATLRCRLGGRWPGCVPTGCADRTGAGWRRGRSPPGPRRPVTRAGSRVRGCRPACRTFQDVDVCF